MFNQHCHFLVFGLEGIIAEGIGPKFYLSSKFMLTSLWSDIDVANILEEVVMGPTMRSM